MIETYAIIAVTLLVLGFVLGIAGVTSLGKRREAAANRIRLASPAAAASAGYARRPRTPYQASQQRADALASLGQPPPR